MMQDGHIINLCRKGQYELAFNGIVEAYSERLYWHVRRFVCTHEDTDDLLQDIFIKIWSALPSFRGDSQLYTWLYRIATNMTLNHLRKMRRENAVSFEGISDMLATRIDEDPGFNGNALRGAERLADTLALTGRVIAMELSGVGTVTDPAACESLLSTLLSNASYESSGSISSKKALLIELDNGLVLQLAVKGDNLAACGVWSCPEFFEAFDNCRN